MRLTVLLLSFFAFTSVANAETRSVSPRSRSYDVEVLTRESEWTELGGRRALVTHFVVSAGGETFELKRRGGERDGAYVAIAGQSDLLPGDMAHVLVEEGESGAWIVDVRLDTPNEKFRTYMDTTRGMNRGITTPMVWRDLPVAWELYDHVPAELTAEQAESALEAAFGAWTAPTCSALRTTFLGRTDVAIEPYDGHNTLEWRESGWAGLGFSAAQIGVTEVEFSRRADGWTYTGADIYLNAETYQWVVEGGRPGSGSVDVQSIVTHEVGHFFGLQHPCEPDGRDGAPVCADDDATTVSMYPAYIGDEGRSLEADDVDGICFLYPSGASASDGGVAGDGGEASDRDGGCSIVGTTDTYNVCTWVFALVLFVLARRKRC